MQINQEDLAAAKDPQTNPELLTKLSESHSKEILEALTQNPSVPLEVLWRLASHFPSQFLQNPLVPLLLLEDLYFLSKVPRGTCSALAALPACPQWVYQSASLHHSQKVRIQIAESPNTPDNIKDLLTKDRDFKVRLAADPVAFLLRQLLLVFLYFLGDHLFSLYRPSYR